MIQFSLVVGHDLGLGFFLRYVDLFAMMVALFGLQVPFQSCCILYVEEF